jgi:hypothetical protein
VQTTLHEARRLGHIKITERPQPGRKNLPNLVEIVSPEWRIWIRRGPSAARRIGSNSAKMVNPTKNTDLRKRVAEEEIRTEWSQSTAPLLGGVGPALPSRAADSQLRHCANALEVECDGDKACIADYKDRDALAPAAAPHLHRS